VGEIRDGETAGIAVQAALTGHRVLSTLHTNDAAGAMTRMTDMGIEPFLVSSVMLVSFAQRLVRRTCPNCRQPYTPSPEAANYWMLKNVDVSGMVVGQGCF
jgi:type IV pilus assembly protein PilB